MMKIAVITGTRAEYGVLSPLLHSIKNSSSIKPLIIVTSMHLLKEFGYTIKEIEEDGSEIVATIDNLSSDDTNTAMAKSVGKCIESMADVFEKIRPDMVLVTGDRGEMLAGAIAAAYMNIPVAHIQGGDVSGNIDDIARHAITKFAHIHFTATKKSWERIIKMGEEPWRIHVVGAPALDPILNKKLIEPEGLAKIYGLDLSKPILLVLQHPVTLESEETGAQIKETLDAVVELKHQTILIYPNADPGGRRMIQVIKKYEKYPFIKAFKTLSHLEYISLMKVVSVLIGNSSSGIIEAPSFHLPVVNIGTRQEGREMAENIIDVSYNKNEIIKAVKKALYDNEFKKKVKKCLNPYGHGKAGKRIMKILSEIKIDDKLLRKKIAY